VEATEGAADAGISLFLTGEIDILVVGILVVGIKVTGILVAGILVVGILLLGVEVEDLVGANDDSRTTSTGAGVAGAIVGLSDVIPEGLGAEGRGLLMTKVVGMMLGFAVVVGASKGRICLLGVAEIAQP
jgi:hypothetical protein